MIKNYIFIFLATAFIACESKPKVIVEDMAPTTNTPTGKDDIPDLNTSSPTEMHQVTAVEVMHTSKYSYLRVVEKTDTFWIASTKFDAKKGGQYLYRGGLLKTNFYSQEFNRNFDKVYLVSSIIDASAHPGSNGQMPTDGQEANVNPSQIKEVAGAVKLSELFKNKTKYQGKSTIVTGKVVKVNNGIMNKNWVHIQDGTGSKDKPNDLTITTSENIPMGAMIALEGKIVLNKDFGAGYAYDIIMEDAVVKK